MPFPQLPPHLPAPPAHPHTPCRTGAPPLTTLTGVCPPQPAALRHQSNIIQGLIAYLEGSNAALEARSEALADALGAGGGGSVMATPAAESAPGGTASAATHASSFTSSESSFAARSGGSATSGGSGASGCGSFSGGGAEPDQADYLHAYEELLREMGHFSGPAADALAEAAAAALLRAARR